MTNAELYWWGRQHKSGNVRYLTNTIMTEYAKPAASLKKLHDLVESGHDVRMGNEYGVIVIDDEIGTLS